MAKKSTGDDEVKISVADGEGTVANAQKFLKDMEYPATKDELIDRARQNGADDEVADTLDMLPDMDYSSSADVDRELESLDEDIGE